MSEIIESNVCSEMPIGSDADISKSNVVLEDINGDKSTKSPPRSNEKDASCKPEQSPSTPQYDLSKFRLHRILHNNSVRKNVALLGTFPDVSDSDDAIIILEKQAFRESDVATPHSAEAPEAATEMAEAARETPATYFNSELKIRTEFVNNIYANYQVAHAALSGVKATVVYPATAKHIEKYSICQKYVINETPELYETVTLPYIESSQFSLDWVYNILEHKQETERIVYEDTDPETGFVLVPDLKWDGHTVESLYLLALTHKRGLKSLRDLNGTHLPMLRKLRTSVAAAIKERYGLAASQLRMYFHYQPSFYHLHMHINPLRNDAPGIWCEKSHMLETVINNLELLPDYYQRASLPFVLYDGNKLLDLYEQRLVVRPTKKASRKSETLTKDEEPSPEVLPSKRMKFEAVVASNNIELKAAQ